MLAHPKKNDFFLAAVGLIFILSVAACATANSGKPSSSVSLAPVQISSSRDRQTGKGYRLPEFEEKKLANGLQLLFVPDDSLPYVSFSLLIKAGSSRDPQGQEGLASFVAELLDKGTVRRSASQVAQELGDMGADFDANAGRDYTSTSISGLSIERNGLLKNFVEIVTQPAFSDAEIERLRKQFLAGIARRIDSPDALADLAFDKFLFGTHPYGQEANGNKKSVSSLRKKDMIRFYLTHYRPNNAILAVVGNLTPEYKSQVEQAFLRWEAKELPVQTMSRAGNASGIEVQIVDKPDLVQSQIRMGNIGIARTNADFIALRVANTILGGAFASRLNSRIRKDLGLTYGISSSFDARLEPGPFEISTFTKNSTVGELLSETHRLIKQFQESGVTSDELQRTKGYLKGIFPSAIETPEKLATNLVLLRFFGIPDSYLTNYLESIDGVSVSQLNRIIAKYFSADNMKIVIYSNASAVEPQVRALNFVKKIERVNASDFQ